MPVRLILNADDFGLTPGINRAVEQLHQAGVLSSATLMASGAAFDEAVAVTQRNPGLGVGCHLVFVDGLPVSHPDDIPTLLGADGKTFRPSFIDFVQAMLRGTVSPAHLAREAQAQIQRLQRAGIDVTHIDSHKHAHLFPAVAQAVLHAAERSGVRAYRYPFEPAWSREATPGSSLVRRVQQSVLNRFEPGFRSLLNLVADEVTTGGTLGIAATGCLDGATLRSLLDALARQPGESVFELCCHPGYQDAALAQQRTRLRRSREVEREALLAVIPQILSTANAPTLIHYGDLGVPGLQRASHQYIPFTGFEEVL